MECYYCNQDVNPNKYFNLNGDEYCSRKCMTEYMTNNKVYSYDTLGGENDYITEELWGCPEDNLLKKIESYYWRYPKNEYDTTHSEISENGSEYRTTIKRLKAKK